jgi:hypothetical protein
VKDPHTNDIKEQAEKRDDNKVEGYYKLVETDGTTRTVHYTADKSQVSTRMCKVPVTLFTLFIFRALKLSSFNFRS